MPGKTEKRIKRSLIRFLADKAAFLSENEAALRWTFNRNLKHWQMNGRAATCLVDGRIEANSKRKVQFSKQTIEKVVNTAIVECAGELAPALRKCHERGEIEEVSTRYLLNPTRKSRVPEALAREVAPQVEALLPHYRGPRQAKLNGAYIERDWSNVGAGDWFSSDDATLEIYFHVPDGAGWFTLMQGQFLPLIDERSKKILDFILIAEQRYTGWNIRTLINKVCSRYGLPRCGFYFERGIWKDSSLVGGAVPFGEVKMTFADRLGLKIEHAQPGNARAKIVENILKLLQTRLRGEPGWVGSNQQTIKMERVQRARLDVEARRKHPTEAGFLSFEQWVCRLQEVCEEYNASPQQSKVMGGNMSPDEAWRLFQKRNAAGEVIPLVKPPEDCLYLLASHTRRVRIGRNGITLPKSLGGGTYRNEVTGHLRAQHPEVNIYFDLEFPEMVSIVTDVHRQVFVIPRAPTCPAHNATSEEIAAAQASVSAHMKAARTRISELRSEYMPRTRPNIVDPRTSAVGREMEAQKKELQSKQQTQRSRQKRLIRLARQAGVHPAAIHDLDAFERLTKSSNEP